MANVLAFIDKLPKPSLFAKVLNIFMLDDYSAHLDASVRKKTLARGYIPIYFGGGITGDVQVNDTHAHHPVKVEYRMNETDWSLDELKKHPEKVPTPSRSNVASFCHQVQQKTPMILPSAFKTNFMTIAFDGSEDHLVGRGLWALVGNEMVQFREELRSQPLPASINELVAAITPPEGVKCPWADAQPDVPWDEGFECIHGDEERENEDDEGGGEEATLSENELNDDDDEGDGVPQAEPAPPHVQPDPLSAPVDPNPPSIPKPPPGSAHEALQLWNELSRFAIQTRHKLPYYMVGCAHKLEQVLRDGYVKLIKYERAKDEASTLVNAQASQDVASSSSSDLARPPANVAPKPKPKPSPRLGRGKPKPRAMGSMAPIDHHFSPLPELPPLPPGFILPPDVFALFSQGPVQDENSAKRPRLM